MLKIIKKFWFVFVIIFLLWYFHYSHIKTYSGCVDSTQELYNVTSKAISTYKSEIKFKTSIDPSILTYEDVLENALAKDVYAACEFFGYEFRYTPNSNGTYTVDLKLKQPRMYKKNRVKKHVKKVSKKFSKFDDYEKIKAVHDYIISNCNYNLFEGGAYQAMYDGHSACNGYALAFYAFMYEMGIPVKCEVGDNHMWNSVMLDGQWYNIDLTWDDPGDGTVHYEYFLKCNSEWSGHEHGSSTADKSMEIKGLSAEEYNSMVPNYKLQLKIFRVLGILAILGTLVVCSILSDKHKKKMRKLKEELEEQNRQMLSEMNRFENDLSEMNAGLNSETRKWYK